MIMTSKQPYLIRATYEWIVDNQCTPFIVVDTDVPDVVVPVQYIKDGQIILNISQAAAKDLRISNDVIEFLGRFGGVSFAVSVPIIAISRIFARETHQGMVFEVSRQPANPEHSLERQSPSPSSNHRGPGDDKPSGDGAKKNKAPHLKAVK